ncbi:unnamed protein product [Vitrella brassicaformis CCMP3155]|uniref:Uncharacterized protein n=1 Tax=Vitrella brassicaformis (strain CCMP3155) TaxID=1169540 RepID=A0A0G4ETZ1_VITBC|nr:unnamed protein product [Vitrella brassicaformis CCMP3155]|eukprot:CEM02097.1 unnamed protein product [Vitrella brassicaformis CCMP3155]
MLDMPEREMETTWEGKGGTLTASVRHCGQDVPLQLNRTDAPIILHIPVPETDSDDPHGLFGDEYGIVQIDGKLKAMNRTEAVRHGRHFIVRRQLTCGYFDYMTQQWSTEGCYHNTTLTTDETIVCHCFHLSEFGVIFRSGVQVEAALNDVGSALANSRLGKAIRDSSFSSVIAESQQSLQRLTNTTAWGNNPGGTADTKTDLFDTWMTDPLLDSRYQSYKWMLQQRKRWLGWFHRCCGGQPCRELQRLCNRLSGRQPTIHVTELKAIRRIREQVILSLRKGDDLHVIRGSPEAAVFEALAASPAYSH